MSDIPPPPPPSDPGYSSPPSPSGGSGPDNENHKLMGAVAHAAPLLDFGSGFVGTVIVLVWYFGFKEKASPFVLSHLKQSIYFLVASWVLYIIGIILAVVTCGIGGFLFLPIIIVVLIMRILAAIKAYAGEGYQYPMVGNWSFLG